MRLPQVMMAGVLLGIGLVGLVWGIDPHPSVSAPPKAGLSSTPTRVASVNITSDEILLALAPERLVAVSELAVDPRISNAVRSASQVPIRLKGDAERILFLEPDLVVIGAHKADVASQIEELGIPVIRIQGFDSLEWIRRLIRELGEAVGEPARAEALVTSLDRRLNAVAARVGSRSRPTVLYYSSGGFTAGTGTLLDEVIRAAGGENIAARLGLAGWKRLSLEQAIIADPEVLLLADSEWWTSQFDQELRRHPAFRGTRAVRTGRIYVLPSRLMITSSHHVAETVEVLARYLHPRAFEGRSL